MAQFPSEATYTLGGTTYTMSNRKPDRGYSFTRSFNSSIFTSQIGYEKRRSISRRAKRAFSFSYDNVSGPYKAAIENFYNNRGGEVESFEFDLSYAGQSGTIIARFNGPLNISQVLTSNDEINDFYTISFDLQETFS